MSYEKLVRDKIPNIIINNGEIPEIEILNDDEYFGLLKAKLVEEAEELLRSDSTLNFYEELADVLEVIDALKKANNVNEDTLDKIKTEKKLKKGAFENKIFLKGVRKEW